MADRGRDALITGVGIVSSLGEGMDRHWEALHSDRPSADTSVLPPYAIHRVVELDFDRQIPRKSDQRQMEPSQRIATYAAGLALDAAKLKDSPELLGRTDMIIATGNGERDCALDSSIFSAPTLEAATKGLNQHLMDGLRPTLFLAQLANMFAGNIAVVHGVTGSSRTFMGEETAGINAMQIAVARIHAGQSDVTLVGGGFNSERPEQLLLYEFGGFALKGFAPVWQRGPKGGIAPGSLGAFLVLEARASADARGVPAIARVTSVLSERSTRGSGDLERALERMWAELSIPGSGTAILSGASGAEPATGDERTFLSRQQGVAVRATGSHLGHAAEPQFVMNIALAAIAIHRGRIFPPTDDSGVEQPMTEPLKRVVVTGVGHRRGEGLALIEEA